MKPYDILQMDTDFWEVAGIHLGAIGQESVVEMWRIGAKPASAYGKSMLSSFVPEKMVREMINKGVVRHYTLQNPDVEKDSG